METPMMLVSCVVHVLQYVHGAILVFEVRDLLYIYVGFGFGTCSPFAGNRGETAEEKVPGTECRNEAIEWRGGGMRMQLWSCDLCTHCTDHEQFVNSPKLRLWSVCYTSDPGSMCEVMQILQLPSGMR